MVLLGDTEGTGTAYIMLEDSGSNTILSYLGANGDYNQEDIDKILSKLPQYGYLCMDLEFSLDAIRKILKASRKAALRPLSTRGPVRKELPLEAFSGAYVLSPNETEAAGMTGIKITDRASAEKACLALYESGCENVILKWGKQGALLYDGSLLTHYPAYGGSGQVVDTTAAGDCFMAGLTCRLSEGCPLDEATVRQYSRLHRRDPAGRHSFSSQPGGSGTHGGKRLSRQAISIDAINKPQKKRSWHKGTANAAASPSAGTSSSFFLFLFDNAASAGPIPIKRST